MLPIAMKVTEEHVLHTRNDRTLQYKIPMRDSKDYKAAYMTDE